VTGSAKCWFTTDLTSFQPVAVADHSHALRVTALRDKCPPMSVFAALQTHPLTPRNLLHVSRMSPHSIMFQFSFSQKLTLTQVL